MLFICCTDTYILTIKKLYVENKDVHANTCPCFNNVEENEFVQLLISSPNVEDVYRIRRLDLFYKKINGYSSILLQRDWINIRLSRIISDMTDKEVKTENFEHCIEAQSLCLGFTSWNVPHLSAAKTIAHTIIFYFSK